MKKTLFSLVACLCICACLCPSSYAVSALDNTEESIAPHNEPATYYWSVVDSTYLGITTREKPRILYDTYTAREAGEKYTFIYLEKKSVEISGHIKAAYRLVEAELGFKIEDTLVKGKEISSRELAKGETIDIYTQDRYQEYKVIQKEVRIDQAGHQSDTGKTEVVYIYKPFPPDPIFVYK